ncbi:hypothetical protein BCU68_11675 [Vibrio sp. 10N.286.49.B3]|uniref:Lrp/AsnC family transcriptional regulator n=1 Tax=Vibrio sp. 10N.286.49.B3 TaxID=1880855 RepID=UPI000C865D99|nr:Lrp/AsnC family transcriptional regulator [Vibrio sp. 10N.286.49.B3]PMH44902.1 hypothetical protein BCU68_11675 [Vibrio sp. 10N.286.49.B3]
MDELDKRLLAQLRSNARTPMVSLAKILGVSRATVQNRIEKLEKNNTILGYTVKLPHDNSGVQVIMSVAVEAKKEATVLKNLQGLSEVKSVYHTNGQWDLIANVEAAHLSLLSGVLSKIRSIDGIVQTETSLLLDQVF